MSQTIDWLPEKLKYQMKLASSAWMLSFERSFNLPWEERRDYKLLSLRVAPINSHWQHPTETLAWPETDDSFYSNWSDSPTTISCRRNLSVSRESEKSQATLMMSIKCFQCNSSHWTNYRTWGYFALCSLSSACNQLPLLIHWDVFHYTHECQKSYRLLNLNLWSDFLYRSFTSH